MRQTKIKHTRYQIDQSIKVENTNKTSYVCLANGKTITISISSKEKQELKLYFRDLGKPLIFKLFTFSVLCAKAIIKIKVGAVTIDTEYSGHERQIKSFILQITRMEDYKEPIISFTQVGKKSSAHLGAYKAMGTKIADVKTTASEILKYYEKTNKS